MMGPLPTLHRVVVAVSGVVAFMGLGAWAALALPAEIFAGAGVGVGAACGAVVVALLLHGSSAGTPQPPWLRHRAH